MTCSKRCFLRILMFLLFLKCISLSCVLCVFARFVILDKIKPVHDLFLRGQSKNELAGIGV